ncbi:hypothetical protein VNO77_08805 [Canavalia gladiata]|uniref:Uncharacterized protein n=1 Tax=Canavalia gladiata TaxID=3824 RepID=A0AAN9ME89_CANGL
MAYYYTHELKSLEPTFSFCYMASRQRPDLLDQLILSWCGNPGCPHCVHTLAHLLTGLGNINRPLRATCGYSLIHARIRDYSSLGDDNHYHPIWGLQVYIKFGPGESSSYSNNLSYGVEFSFGAKRPRPDSQSSALPPPLFLINRPSSLCSLFSPFMLIPLLFLLLLENLSFLFSASTFFCFFS